MLNKQDCLKITGLVIADFIILVILEKDVSVFCECVIAMPWVVVYVHMVIDIRHLLSALHLVYFLCIFRYSFWLKEDIIFRSIRVI